MSGLNIQKEFKDYHIKFNLPIQLATIFSIIFFSYNINKVVALTTFLYIIIYWVGTQCGSHKLFAHKSWKPRNQFIKYVLAYISCFGLMGGPILWSSVHRWHHAHSDKNLDPHSPKDGILHSYFTWFLNAPHIPLRIVKDYIGDPRLVKIDKNCKSIVLITLLLFFLIDYELGISLLLAMTISFNFEMSINAFAHKKVNNDWNPVNYTFLGFITGGSALHLNHHNDPSNYSFSNKWYEIDPSVWIINVLKEK